MVLSAERAAVGIEWVLSGGVRIRKQIVTATRTVEVTVRREELVVEFRDIVAASPDGMTWAGTSYDGPPSPPPVAQHPLVLVLHEEVPDIQLHTRAYERVTTQRVLVTEQVALDTTLRREAVVLETATPTSPT